MATLPTCGRTQKDPSVHRRGKEKGKEGKGKERKKEGKKEGEKKKGEKKGEKERETTFHVTLIDILKSKTFTQEELIYEVCTKEEHYKDCKNFLHFGWRFLAKTLNECELEAHFITINETDSSGRPFTHATIEKICYIRINGPDPLVAQPLVKLALDEHFNGKWHFTTDRNSFFTSPAIKTQTKAAHEKFTLF